MSAHESAKRSEAIRQALVRCVVLASCPLAIGLTAARQEPVAQDVLVRLAAPAAVEWIDLGAPAPTVVATRQVAAGVTALRVAASARQAVRFRSPGWSPITVPVERLREQQPYEVPQAPGGEIVLVLPARTIQPEFYELIADAQRVAMKADHGVASAHGVPAGAYTLTPHYRGGLAGSAHQVAIVDSESQVAVAPVDAVGGVHVQLEPVMCRIAERVDIGSFSGSALQAIASHPASPECAAEVAGLASGVYDVVVRGRQGILEHQRVEVQVDGLSRVSVVDPTARVSGALTLNGRPLVSASLMFLGLAETGRLRRADVKADLAGRFEVYLNGLQTYHVQLTMPGSIGHAQSVTPDEGDNILDWSLSGGTVVIDLRNWDGSQATLDVAQAATALSVSQRRRVAITRAEQLPLSLQALPPGTYHLSARTNRGLASPVRTIELTSASDRAVVTLDLAYRAGTLRVIDERGLDVPGATAIVERRRLESLGPGLFDLTGTPAGARVQVSAPAFSPMCLALTQADTARVVQMSRGRTVFAAPGEMDRLPPGELLGAEGSTCGIPFLALSRRWNADRQEVQVDGFPFGSPLFLAWAGSRIEVRVGADQRLTFVR